MQVYERCTSPGLLAFGLLTEGSMLIMQFRPLETSLIALLT